jgi:thioredoxin-like negative regulator of GroEL
VWTTFAGEADGAPAPLSMSQLGLMLRALNVDAGEEEVRRVYLELGGSAEGVPWAAFRCWWEANAAEAAEGGPVELVLSGEQFSAILAEEAREGGRLVCLECGMSYCRPCRAFEKTYKRVAAELPSVRFLRVNGNENRSCTALVRDQLGIRSTPAFFLFKHGDAAPVASFTGANEERLRENIRRAQADEAEAPLPPPASGALDVREAQSSGLSARLELLGAAQKRVDKLKGELRQAEAAVRELEAELRSQAMKR